MRKISIQNNSTISDLTFIGSGIAASFTIIPFLKGLKEKSSELTTYRITIIEKADEFHTGLAYGPRSGSSALLITSLADFLPPGPERDDFIEWLSNNKDRLIENLRSDGEELTENWIKTHSQEIERNDWKDIYIPRRFFGFYIKEKVEQAIASLNSGLQLEVNYITDEAIAVERTDEGFTVILKDHQRVLTQKLVLSIGIPPVKRLWSEDYESRYSDEVCFIKDPYHPGLTINLDNIEAFAKSKEDQLNFLIIGSNASAMEMIYKLNDRKSIREKINCLNIISPLGALPNSAQDEFTKSATYEPKFLKALESFEKLSAKQIYEAASKDLDEAEELGLSAAVTEVPISTAFIGLLDKLDHEELLKFACKYGNAIGKRQRRAGKHYTDVVDRLKSEGKLKLIKGYFTGLTPNPSEDGTDFLSRSASESDEKPNNMAIQVVINCMGSRNMSSRPISPLLDQLLSSGLGRANGSNIGLEVNDNLELSPGFYVTGPLLAGNIINGKAFWHLEHCGRIIHFGKFLAKRLLS